MSRPSPIAGARISSIEAVEILLGRQCWTWADYVAAGAREFDLLYCETDGPSPFAPGNRAIYAVKYAELACPRAKRCVAPKWRVETIVGPDDQSE